MAPQTEQAHRTACASPRQPQFHRTVQEDAQHMNAIVRQDQLPGMPGPANLLEVISRAASDPNVDADKMDRLWHLHERISARQAEIAFNVAMTACQTEMPAVLR